VQSAAAKLRGVPASVAVISAAAALLTAYIVHGGATSKYAPLAVIGVVLGAVAIRLAKQWTWVLTAALVAIILIPNDGRYLLAAHFPIQIQPYRLVVGGILIGWLVALLVDPRVRARATGFDAPMITLIVATLGSEVVNPGRVGSLSSYVIKAMLLFATLIFLFYLVVSVVRTRAMLERLLTVLVVAGAIEGFGAIYQRRSGNNLFNSMHALLPGFNFTGFSGAASEIRGGLIRATASAGHPIELSATMAMLLPLAIYLAISRRQKAWWLAVVLLLGGDFAGGSRTGVVSLLVIILTFLWLRPRQTLRCWPALLPALVAVHFVAPGAIGGVRANFFPAGGIVAQQSSVLVGKGGKVQDNSRLSRWGPSFHEYLQGNPLFGDGYGTRVTGAGANGLPNPDDNATVLDDEWLGTMLETGLVGIIAWVWLFGRAIKRLAARAKLERGTREGWLPVALAGSIGSFAASMFFYDAFSFIQATCVVFVLLAIAAVLLMLPPVTQRLPGKRAAEA
jgi:polysaccharide biosynthesis protein PslJ